MKVQIKKSIIAVGALLALSLTAAAATGTIESLNTSLVNLLAPFNNDTTTAKAVFTALKTDATRALKLQTSFLYSKTGKRGTIGLNIPNISYVYDAANPTLKVSANLAADLSALTGGKQADFNTIATDGDKQLSGFITDFTKKYGAMSTQSYNSQFVKDAAGNVVSGTFAVDVKINIDALTADQQATETAKAFTVSLVVNRDKGVTVDATIIMNAKNTSFSKEGLGMKEYIESLLAQDKDAINGIQDLFKGLDSMATSFMDQKPNN